MAPIEVCEFWISLGQGQCESNHGVIQSPEHGVIHWADSTKVEQSLDLGLSYWGRVFDEVGSWASIRGPANLSQLIMALSGRELWRL